MFLVIIMDELVYNPGFTIEKTLLDPAIKSKVLAVLPTNIRYFLLAQRWP